MNKPALLLAAFFLLLFSTSFSQKPTINWGDEFKLKKGSTHLRVIDSDATGVLLEEGHLALKSYFVIGATVRSSGRLVKLDKNFNEIYNVAYDRELKGKEFEQFFKLGKKIFIISSSFKKSSRELTLFASEINRNDGQMVSGWTELKTITKDDKKESIDYELHYNSDSTKMVIVSSVTGRSKSSFSLLEINQNLRPSAKEIIVNTGSEAEVYRLENIVYTNNKRVILVGKEFEFEEGKKEKDKNLVFAQYNIKMFDDKGKQIKEFSTEIDGKWLMNTSVFQEKDSDIILTSFYSTAKKAKEINGILIQRIDPLTGDVKKTAQGPIDYSFLAEDNKPEEDADETRKERYEREQIEKLVASQKGLAPTISFRKLIHTHDGGMLIIAENFRVYTVSRYNPSNGSYSHTTVYDSKELIFCKVNAENNIEYVKILPKFQRESYSASAGVGPNLTSMLGFPYYSGFSIMESGNNIHLFFNDNPKNESITKAGQIPKVVHKFQKSHNFVLTLNLETGDITRKFFFSNADNVSSMPRYASVFGNVLYLIGMNRSIFGQSKIAVAKIELK